MSMTPREAALELLYARLSADEKKLVDLWDTYGPDDRSAYWSTMSRDASRYIYMITDGRPGLL
jgi:hypothetical protein